MRRMMFLCLFTFCTAMAAPGQAADGFRLAAPQELVDSGLLKYVLPRFSLKTGVRIELVAEADGAEMVLAASGEGRRVFSGPTATWRIRHGDHAGAKRFADWLSSEIGQRTVTGFKVDGEAVFTLPREEEVALVAVSFEGNAVQGKALSLTHCGRCHVVDKAKRMSAIGSTPSFMVLRSLKDWDTRFQSFYTRNPHPAFTQVANVTPPFPINRPPPIIPVEITVTDLESILAFVSAMKPADLGAPLIHQ